MVPAVGSPMSFVGKDCGICTASLSIRISLASPICDDSAYNISGSTVGTGVLSLGRLAGEEGSDTVGDGVGEADGEGVGLPLNLGDGKDGTLCPGDLLMTCLGF